MAQFEQVYAIAKVLKEKGSCIIFGGPHATLAYDFDPRIKEIADCVVLGEGERAERTYRQALEANSGPFFDPTLEYNFGRFLLKQGRLEESQMRRATGFEPRQLAKHARQMLLRWVAAHPVEIGAPSLLPVAGALLRIGGEAVGLRSGGDRVSLF